METKFIQLTSGKGPAECELAVALALRTLIAEAKQAGLVHEVISRSAGSQNGTLASALLKLEGKNPDAFLSSWLGAVLWIAQSPYRKFHKRKNWFIGVNAISKNDFRMLDEKDITFQTMRSSGPGGQNVNKTETAVRAIHTKSGLYATCDSFRSQLQNKNEALKRLNEKYIAWQQNEIMKQGLKTEQFYNNNLNRGNPVRTYTGEKFLRQ